MSVRMRIYCQLYKDISQHYIKGLIGVIFKQNTEIHSHSYQKARNTIVKQLGIAMQTLSNWYNKANQSKLIGTEQHDPELMTAIQEIK